MLRGLLPLTTICFPGYCHTLRRRTYLQGIEFKSLIPKLYFPSFLKDSLGYRTHAKVSLPVLNPKTILNTASIATSLWSTTTI